MKPTIEFKRDEAGIRDAAILIAQFVREGITFSVQTDNVGIAITLTGGF